MEKFCQYRMESANCAKNDDDSKDEITSITANNVTDRAPSVIEDDVGSDIHGSHLDLVPVREMEIIRMHPRKTTPEPMEIVDVYPRSGWAGDGREGARGVTSAPLPSWRHEVDRYDLEGAHHCPRESPRFSEEGLETVVHRPCPQVALTRHEPPRDPHRQMEPENLRRGSVSTVCTDIGRQGDSKESRLLTTTHSPLKGLEKLEGPLTLECNLHSSPPTDFANKIEDPPAKIFPMGSYKSSPSQEDDQEKTKEMERHSKLDKENALKKVKLLLLGAGECGKSTVLKQMSIIHGNGYQEEGKREHIPIIYANVVQSAATILRAMDMLCIPLANEMLIAQKLVIFESIKNAEEGSLRKETFKALRILWQDEGVQQVFDRAKEYQLIDSAEYYLTDLDRIAAEDYIPTEQDILRSRIKTTGIIESSFRFKGLEFNVLDVGGERSERKKWMHCFEGVTAILFLVALSEYDLKLVEDQITNRMHESMRLFDSICNSPWFVATSIILFLNKTDIFETKITISPLTVCFPQYAGENSYIQARTYIKVKFEALNKKKSTKVIYSHYTCATDTNSIEVVFDAVIDVIVKNNIKDVGLF